MQTRYDVVILGGGHNGLVAAAYLGRAGMSVLVLEKNDYIGGATASARLFQDYDATISRYAYLVSLFPQKIIDDLGLNLELRQRKTASFTPYLKNGTHSSLLISNAEPARSADSLRELTGNDSEARSFDQFYELTRVFADHTWDTMLEPLVSKEAIYDRLQKDERSREAWRSFVEEPLGYAVERYLHDDLVRGLVFTDAKIGVFSSAYDETLLQNRCFLYHTIGNKTGEWKVPVGGMGAVASDLERAARAAGTECKTEANIVAIDVASKKCSVEFEADGRSHRIDAQFLLANFGHDVLCRYLGIDDRPRLEDEGSVFKINMLLRRLPKLKARQTDAAEAFCGTFHCHEDYKEMELSYLAAAKGKLSSKPPCELYCHTLTDSSILSPELRSEGYHTMTLFGLDAPYSFFRANNDEMRHEAETRYLASVNEWLEEPIEDCLAIACDGNPCIESMSPVDLENSLGMWRGNIFHNAPSFPFATADEQVGSWGVETQWPNVFLCGSSAARGGAVSGIPGHNAAMAVLTARGLAKRAINCASASKNAD